MNALYRLALRLLPAAVREQHGPQMAAVFDALLREARGQRARGGHGALRVVVREFFALAWFAWCARRGAAHPRRIDERPFIWPSGPPRRPPLFSSILADLRYAARGLVRTPGFTLVALGTMALALGANTAIYSVVHGVLWRALPFAKPQALVLLGHHARTGPGSGRALDATSAGIFHDWQDGTTAFSSMAAFEPIEPVVTWSGGAERVRGGLSVGSIFDVLGRDAAEGRTFSSAEERSDGESIAVLSAGLARRIFGEGPAVGQNLGINGQPHTIVGVMPADFAFLDHDSEFWIPARFSASRRLNRGEYELTGVARLHPGVSIEQARSQLETVTESIRRAHPRETENLIAAVEPVKEVLLAGYEKRLLTLQGTVLLLLLIACANMANLLLARAMTRRRELAVRQALGARTGRLARQLLTESLLLAVVGGAVGFALAAGLRRALVASLPDTLPRLAGTSLDADVLLFTALASLGAGVLFGVFPALHLARHQPVAALREGARAGTRHRAVRSSLVAAEVALAMMLLAGAGLLTRSYGNLNSIPPGFSLRTLLTFSLAAPSAGHATGAERVAFFERVSDELRRLPGVTAVTRTSRLPLSGRGVGAWFNDLDQPGPADRTPPSVPYRIVSPDYLEILGVPLVAGRHLNTGDGLDGTRAVVVSESVARRFWPGESALGHRIYLGAPEYRIFPDAEIVGVAADVKQSGFAEEVSETVYIPNALTRWPPEFDFALRTSVEPLSVVSAVRAAIQRIDPAVAPVRIQTMEDVAAQSNSAARSSMSLVGLFALVALALAMIGVFGVLSYTLGQQTTEMGIRLALGANAAKLQAMVIARGMAPVGAGLVLGLAGALALTRFLRSLLFGVEATDPFTYAVVIALVAMISGLASYLPARRVARLDPARVLRQD